MTSSQVNTVPRVHMFGRAFAPEVIFCVKLLCYLGLLSIGLASAQTHNLLVQIGATVLIGAMFAHGVELQHQLLHGTGLKSRRLSRLIGFLVGLPMLVSYSAYQASHLRHHMLVGTKEDREFFDYGERNRATLSAVFVHLLMLKHYLGFAQRLMTAIRGKPFPNTSPSRSARIRSEYLTMAAFVATALIVSAIWGFHVLLALWLIPLCLVAAPIHALIELPEHYGCSRENRDPVQNTRTIRSNWFMAWFTNGNNFHVEHHSKMDTPIECLRDVHEIIAPMLIHKNGSYREFYATFIADLWRDLRARRSAVA